MSTRPNIDAVIKLSFVLPMIGFALLLTACASHKPKSSARIIMEGERSPFITDKPERAGETVREAGPR
jgi:hypothetical protein